MTFQTRNELKGKVTVIQIPQTLDLHNADDLKIILSELIKNGNYNWVIDLQNTEYLDSSGLGAIVSQISDCRTNQGDIHLVAPYEFIQSLLEVTHLNKVLTSFDSVESAIHGFID